VIATTGIARRSERRVVAISGAARGIGPATAERLYRERGWDQKILRG